MYFLLGEETDTALDGHEFVVSYSFDVMFNSNRRENPLINIHPATRHIKVNKLRRSSGNKTV